MEKKENLPLTEGQKEMEASLSSPQYKRLLSNEAAVDYFIKLNGGIVSGESDKLWTFEIFKLLFDKDDAVVLLEGKREVPPQDVDKIIAMGRFLAKNTQHIRFRSGNAAGTDFYFSQGVAEIDRSRLEIVVPQTGHRKKFVLMDHIISLESIDLKNNTGLVELSKRNVKTRHLIDGYVAGRRDKFYLKAAAYILRDTLKVTGTAEIFPAVFGIFYDNLEKPKTGGTGHTIDVCEQKNIPAINQTVWFNWLRKHS
jgi:hypothetical protein